MQTDEPILWLVVENDDDDSFLMRRAFGRVKTPGRFYWAKDGHEARSFLLGEGAFQDRDAFPLPALILSDLKMPLVTGLELLAWAKNQSSLAQIPFVLLTSSNRAKDREQADALGVDDYLVKPARFQDLLKLVEGISARFLKAEDSPASA